MPIAINGSGTVTGISVGGLPDGIVDTDMLASKAATAPKLGAGTIIQTVVVKSDTTSSLNTTSFTEASSDYRISITPINSANRIFISITTAGTMNGANNTVFMSRIQNFTSGSAAHITSTAAGGNRHRVDYVARPNNGQDANDVYVMHLFGFDDPGTTSQQTYGFDYRRENGGSGTIFFGQSEDGDVSYSSRTPTILIAQEVVI